MPPQKRPLILLHKCTECATFALSPMPFEEKKFDMETIRLRFSRVLQLDNDQGAETGAAKIDVGHDDDSAYSSVSGQSSPDDSPLRSDSPSPPVEITSLFVSTRPQLFRSRSASESGTNGVPLKGILKRRQPVMRFLSQCEEEDHSICDPEPNGVTEFRSSTEDCMDISESGDDDDNPRERSQSTSKKTVRFNDRVQENLFRPNSSILGQKKKNQRKQQRKRKRTNSGDSQTGGSECDNDTDVGSQDLNVELLDPGKDAEVFADDLDHEQNQNQSTQGDEKMKKQQRGFQKKCQKKTVAIDKRYDGFVINDKKPNPGRHRRHSSGDSAMGDDEEDQDQVQTSKKEKRRTISCGASTDSGIDVE